MDLLFNMYGGAMNKILCGCGLVSECELVLYEDLLLKMDRAEEKTAKIFIEKRTFRHGPQSIAKSHDF